MVELPLVVIDVQRAGPSTGMPTKTEQADLLQAMFGRNCDSPCRSSRRPRPAECFDMPSRRGGSRCKYMTPVVYLSRRVPRQGRGAVANPDARRTCRTSAVANATPTTATVPAVRARPGDARAAVGRAGHAGPGAPHRRPGEGRHHRQRQLRPRQPPSDAAPAPRKSRRHRQGHPAARGLRAGRRAICWSWAGARTYGAHPERGRATPGGGRRVAHAQVRYLNPFPANIEDVLRSYKHVLVPEVNLGQLSLLLRAKFLIDVKGSTRCAASRSASPRSSDEAEQLLGDR